MATGRHRTNTFYVSFYWIGMAMVLGCLGLTLASNTESIYRFEHTSFPLSWGLAILAVLAFLAAELCHPVAIPANNTEDEAADLVPDWEAISV